MKYLLSEYEIYLSRMAKEELPISQNEILSSPKCQVEHIWAQHPVDLSKEKEREHDGGVGESHEPTVCSFCKLKVEHGSNVHRLGNLTLTTWNQALSNKSFSDKKCEYKGSSLRVQRDLADFAEWNSDTIKEREDRIVEFALKRWSV